MFNYRPILLVNGTLLCILAAAMLVPALVDLALENPDWKTFMGSCFVTGFLGGSLYLANRGAGEGLTVRQAFVLTASSWLTMAAFSALPLYFSELNLTYTDAFFESMSAITTTGSTVLVGLDQAPPGILLWRSLLQWLGGIGFIVLGIAILPMLQIGGMQLFRTESSDKSEKVLPRAAQIANVIGGIYILLTMIAAIAYWMAGMTGFDAINHALTSLATGGFSTHDASIGYFDNPTIEILVTVFMLMGGIPFILYFQFLRGRHELLFQDTQVRWYMLTFAAITGVVTLWLIWMQNFSFGDSLRYAAFHVASLITTTGYASTDYNSWGNFIIVVMFLLTVVGGCTGSTSGGIKIFRYQVLYSTAKAQIHRLVHPHGVFLPTYNHKPVSEKVTGSVMSFFILFAMCFQIIALGLALTGLDYITSMSAAASALANLGPGLGPVIGPAGNYSSLPDMAKWLMAAGMIIGRLELFTVLVLFTPHFWRD